MKKLFLFTLICFFMISFSSAALTDDLLAYYKLDGASGTVIDSTGNANGTNSGATRNIAGKINKSFDFEETDGDSVNISNGASPGDALDFTGDLTFCTWIKPESYPNTQNYIIGKRDAAAGYQYVFRVSSAGNMSFLASGGAVQSANTSVPIGSWSFLCVVREDAANTTFYYNGYQDSTFVSKSIAHKNNDVRLGNADFGGVDWDGLIDEVGMWNRTLSAAEITELWNSGSGFSYPFGGVTREIFLVSPANGTTISDVGTNFTVAGSNVSDIGGIWTNLTYYVWQNSTLFNETTVSVSGETFNNTLFIDNFARAEYEWSAHACYSNVTGDYCLNASENFTLTVSLYTLVSEGYINDTISGTLETFNLSIDLFPGIDLTDAVFYYEGEIATPSILAQGDNRFVLISDFQIPLEATDVNNSFLWELEFNNNETVNTTSNTQLVRAIFLDNCSVYTNRIFNISLNDEQTKNSLSGDIELIYTILNENYQEIKTYNLSIESVSSTFVCSVLNLSDEPLFYSAEIRYTSDGYASELYHIQRAAIGAGAQQVDLYDINSTDSTEFKVTYQDSTFNFVEGAILQLQRKYISEDAYEVVEAPLTSSDGVAVLHIDLNSIKYKATLVKNGVVLDVFDNIVFKCQSELTGECEHKLLGEINPQNDVNLDNTRDFAYSSPVLSNGTISVSFSVPSGAPGVINLVLEQKDVFSNKTLCNQTITSSAGSISCAYSESLGESYIDLTLYKDGVPMAKKTYVLHPSGDLDWLGNNYIFILIILFSLVGMALSSPEWIIVNGIITMVISGGLWLANGLDFVMGLGNIVWLVIAAIILIMKISKQEDR